MGPAGLLDARRVAERRFGIGRLHPEQAQAIESLLAGRDVLVVLPTGYGKSLIYQVPALLAESPTIVVSPLIALMQDQQRALRARNVPVVRLDSTLKAAERREAYERLGQGGALVVLTTPETLESEAVAPLLAASKPWLLCIDEAHCISEWGHDFRPSYLRLGIQRRALGVGRVLALTATATPQVRGDIAERLGMTDPVQIVAAPARPNLRLSVVMAPGSYKIEEAGRLLRRLRRPAIVYCATTRAVDEIYVALRRARFQCMRYHGGMTTAERTAEQKKFMKPGGRQIMVATSAFGMGIDKPDIRSIMHYQATGSLEQYVQEAGRAGRDGRPAECVLLFDPADLAIHEFLQQKSSPTAAQARKVASALTAWADEGREAVASDLALSAQVPVTICRALLTQFQELGLVEEVERRKFLARADAAQLREGAADLAGKIEVQRRQDARRLRAIAEYAEQEGCRAAFLRSWFGEENPPPCGRCDRCRESGASPPEPDRAQADGAAPGGRRHGQRGRGRKRGRRGRGGRRRRGGGGDREPSRPGGPGPEHTQPGG